MLNLDELTNMINLLRDYILKIYFLEIIVVHRKGIKPYSYFGGERGGGIINRTKKNAANYYVNSVRPCMLVVPLIVIIRFYTKIQDMFF